jgi:serine/threonine protein kinase
MHHSKETNSSEVSCPLEDAAGRFSAWRLNKKYRLDRVPPELKDLVLKLLDSYPKKRISKTLQLSNAFLNSLQGNVPSPKATEESNIDFIPFKLGEPEQITQNDSLHLTCGKPNGEDRAAADLRLEQPPELPLVELIKPNSGTKLLVRTNDPQIISSIINSFLTCSN